MNKHDHQLCPRCEKEFICKVNNINLCQCMSVTLSQAQLEYIKHRYDDCLCQTCLLALRKEFNLRQHKSKLAEFQQF